MPRKPRSDSRLKSLPEDQQALIYGWCADGYDAARVRCRKDLGIATSETALGNFWRWYTLREKLQHATDIQAQVEEMISAGTNLDAAKVKAIGQAVFLNQALQESDADTFAAIARLMTAQDKLQLEREQLRQKVREYEDKIAKAKAELAGATANARSAGLTEETLAKIEQAAQLL